MSIIVSDPIIALGKIKFDERGDAIGVGFSMFQVKNGEYVEVK